MSKIDAELDKKNPGKPEATPSASSATALPQSSGWGNSMYSAIRFFMGGSTNAPAAPAQQSTAQVVAQITIQPHASSSPVNSSAENSPRYHLSGAEKPHHKSDSSSPAHSATAKPTPIASGVAAADGDNTKASTPNSQDSFERINHSATHSPETLHYAPPLIGAREPYAPPLIGDGEPSPLPLPPASASTKVPPHLQATVRSSPNSGTNSPDFPSSTPFYTPLSIAGPSSPNVAGQALPSATGKLPIPADGRSLLEAQHMSKLVDDISTLRYQLKQKEQLLKQQEFKINTLNATIDRHDKEDRERLKAHLSTPANANSNVIQEQYVKMQRDLKLLTERNTALESELAATRNDLASARKSMMEQDRDEINSPVYQRGIQAGIARETARVLAAQQAAIEAEQRRVAAHQAAEAARVAQAAAAVAHANAVKQAADAAAQRAAAAAAAETARRQNFMRGI